MEKFSQQYAVIYDYFKNCAEKDQKPSSKLDLARLLGVSQGQMQNWEKGQRPNALACLTIHKKLGFEFEWLITGQGPARKDGVEATQKPPTPHIDAALLRQVIEMLEEHLQAVKAKMSPAAKATVVSQLYEMLVEQEAQAREPIQMMRLVMGALAKAANE